LKNLCRARVEAEVERQLPMPRRQQISKNGPKACPFGKLGVRLPDRRQIRERVEDFPVCAMGWIDQPPFLHVAEVIVAQVRMSLEHLSTRDRTGTRSGHSGHSL
jgi:hypothetical protein